MSKFIDGSGTTKPVSVVLAHHSSSFGSTVCHESEARNMGPCSRMYVYVTAHYHTQSFILGLVSSIRLLTARYCHFLLVG